MTRQWVTRHGRTFEVGTLNSAVPPAPTPKRRKHGPFTKIPIVWEEELGKAHASGSTYAVAIVLLYEAWRLKINGQKEDVIQAIPPDQLPPIGSCQIK